MSSDVPAANSPPADVAMTPQAMLNDAEVVATRVRGNRVPEGSNLTVVEKISFQDLLQEWCDARPATIGHTQVLTEELRKGFFPKVFTNWDSDESCVPLPSMAPRTLQKSSFHAGYLKDNLPITPQKRKRGVTVQDNPKRMALQPAYLTVEFSSESEGKELRFVWRDEKGTRVPVDYIEYREDVTKAQAIQSAIEA
ncbi:uncharacterized protein FTJAE_8942 [Fusarium tjaetaba]|uniref:Uncharacterized protein n=1 Tax=Fusarium tjaetaba TaxID=1567544 RepID=A0A8H5VMW5_9HYPO|nr:uncharacterized protein FTJAE_8942 [Fusarium tjaetaba]KAF5628190.1 hypothetical protein FTJAE_8942 [Fusarium tjaetaba]